MIMPVLFVSHGAPTMVISNTPASIAMRSLARHVAKPKAILVISAHWEERGPVLGLGTETIHDFYGFPQELYRLQYPAAPATETATQAADLLTTAGFAPRVDSARGRDHGVWSPLLLAWPQADVPVVQLALNTNEDNAGLFAMGRALTPLREEGVLIIGSGSATHNLRARPTPAPADWASEFADWLDRTLDAGDDDALLKWQDLAPQARINHPTTEHFDPMLVARGAADGSASRFPDLRRQLNQ
jgi:4,5-DOPA dioxygenase extradiol